MLLLRRLQIRDNREEGADLVSDVWDRPNSRDSGVSQLQDKEVVNLPPLVDQTSPVPFRRVVTAPGTVLISGARVGRKMHIAHMHGIFLSPLIPSTMPRRLTPSLLLL